MAKRFLALAAGSPGASTDCTALGAARTVVVGGTLTGAVVLEVSQDNANWVPLHTFGAPGSKELQVAAAFMRVNGGGAGVNADVAGEDSLTTRITSLNVTAGNGSGTASDISGFGDVKSVVVTGAFRGAVVIEQSLDGGTTWDPLKTFSRAGVWTGSFAAELIRVTRNNAGGATPVVSIGGADINPAERQQVIAPPVVAQTTALLDTTLQFDPTGGAFPIDLPPIVDSTQGARIVIKNVTADLTAVTVTPDGGDTIDGAANFVMNVAQQCIIIESDGIGNWNIIAQHP
jgi:hypothetical protein